MTYDNYLETERESVEYSRDLPEAIKTVYAVVNSGSKNKPLKSLYLAFSTYDLEEAKTALENDTATATLCDIEKEIKSISLCEIPEDKFCMRRINSCSEYLTILQTNIL